MVCEPAKGVAVRHAEEADRLLYKLAHLEPEQSAFLIASRANAHATLANFYLSLASA